jgi:ParB/RepB/Spo0J family partition protein
MFLNPKSITVERDSRQRRSLDDISDLKQSIATLKQINPIIVRQGEGGTTVLVAGERRLRACAELNIDVEVKFWEDLSAYEAREIELEENIKRSDLPWRDYAKAVADLHAIRLTQDETWTAEKTSKRLSLDLPWVYIILHVNKNLNSKMLEDAQGIRHAYSLLQRASERRSAAVVGELAAAGASAFGSEAAPAAGPVSEVGEAGRATLGAVGTDGNGIIPPDNEVVLPPPAPPPIANTSFLTWAKAYTGPKFNLIHCDFPFGIKFTGGYGQEEDSIKYESTEDDYWTLVDCLCANTDRLASYSSHLVFWFSMSFYTETCRRLRAAGWKVQDHPLVWYKSDGQGIIPGRNEYPRRVYETALLASRGSRPLVKMVDNCYACPRAANAIHPSTKPEPMLRHFFNAVVDSTTDLLDPTCGSGGALRAAEDVGARSVLGLEIDADFAKAANAATLNARAMRRAAL